MSEFETCSMCSGTGMQIGDGGDPSICGECHGDTVVKLVAPIDDLVKQLMHATVLVDGDFDVGCNVRDAAVERLERSEAATAAAYEVAARKIQPSKEPSYHIDLRAIRMKYADAIRALATPDQTAALERLIAEAEARVWEQAELIARNTGTCLMPSGHFLSERCADAILAASKKGAP